MIQKFIEKGYEIVNHTEKADIYIVNTCTVTNMSDRKSRQMLRKQKQINPYSIVVACGCYVQVAKDELEKIEEIDLVLGNVEKKDIVEIVEKYIKENKEKVEVADINEKQEFSEFGEVIYSEKPSAVLKLQAGCDRFCS